MICLLGFLVLFLSVFVACTNSLVTYKGKTADKKSRIACLMDRTKESGRQTI